MKIGKFKLKWKKSVSSDIVAVTLTVAVDSLESSVELGPDVEEYMVDISANQSCTFSLSAADDEGNTVTSQSHTFVVGDLELPQPPTDLGHELVSVRDEADE